MRDRASQCGGNGVVGRVNIWEKCDTSEQGPPRPSPFCVHAVHAGASSETYLSGMAQYSRKHQDCVPVPGPVAVLCICLFRLEGSIEGHVAKPFGRGWRGWYPASHVLILRRTQK